MPRGFVLDSTWRMEGARPVAHLWGVLVGGASFLVRDRGVVPHFFILAADSARASALGLGPAATSLRTMASEPVARIEHPNPGDGSRLRDRLRSHGIATFEADLRFPVRHALDRGIRGALAIDGPSAPGERVAHVFEDPKIERDDFAPDLRVLALDIETDPDASRVLAIALHGAGTAEVHVLAGGGGVLPSYATAHPDESALLARFAERVRALDPDVLTGWNVIGFDLAVLERRARSLGVPLVLGRGETPLKVSVDGSFWGTSRAAVEGRAVLDGQSLLRGAFVKVEDFRLDTVARQILGEGKTMSARGRPEEIERLWRADLEAFSAYNLKDAELVSRILETTGLVRLAVRRSLLTGMALDRVSASIASFDSLYLPELRRRGFVAPTVGEAAAAAAVAGEHDEATAGGAVLEPIPGLHERVLVFDFKSLYPSLMRTFNIDPLTHVRDPAPGADVIRTPAGACFSREPGILQEILARLLAERERAKRAGDATSSQATKILMNSFYGVLATPNCRFHSAALANAITGTGQALLFWTRDHARALGHRVLYGDTDSLFVAAGVASDGEAFTVGHALAARLNADLEAHLASAYRVESRLELELEGLYAQLFLPPMRHTAAGARKRYVGLRVEEDGQREIVFVGMESVRRDWTEAAKEFQRGLYERVFARTPIEGFVREFIATLRSGERDTQLVYKKSLRKDAAAYTATTPPHVKAARIEGTPSRIIEYVMTAAGPEPISARRGALDYEHYVEKQLRPIAEAVLPLLGLDWDEIAGNPRQLSLF